jgi:hypothetical protein
MQSVTQAAKGLPGRLVPNVRSSWIFVRNRLFAGTLLLVFVYAAGSSTPSAIANYRLESHRRSGAPPANPAAVVEHERLGPEQPHVSWREWLGMGPWPK